MSANILHSGIAGAARIATYLPVCATGASYLTCAAQADTAGNKRGRVTVDTGGGLSCSSGTRPSVCYLKASAGSKTMRKGTIMLLVVGTLLLARCYARAGQISASDDQDKIVIIFKDGHQQSF